MARSRRKQKEDLQERRTARRLPVTGPRSEGLLQAGDRKLPVSVCDESAGGFCIEFDRVEDFRIDDMLQLCIGDDWYKVRVVFVDLQDVGAERFEGCNLTSHTRLGLMRMAEDENWKMTRRDPNLSPRLRTTRVLLRKSSLAAAAVGIVACLFVFGGALTSTLKRSKPLDPVARGDGEARVANVGKALVLAPKPRWSLRNNEKIEEDEADEPLPKGKMLVDTRRLSGKAPERAKPGKTADRVPQAKGFLPRLPDDVIPVPSASKVVASIPSLPSFKVTPRIIRLAHPEHLLRPDIARQLNLSQTQLVRLRRLLVEQKTSNQSLSEALTDDEPHLVLGRRALGVLTNEQKLLLEKLQNESSPEATSNQGASVPRPQWQDHQPTRTA